MPSLFSSENIGPYSSTAKYSRALGGVEQGRNIIMGKVQFGNEKTGSVLGDSTSSVGGGGGGGTPVGGSVPTDIPQEQVPSGPDTSAYDAAFQQALDALGQAEGASRSVYAANQAEIRGGAENLKSKIGQAKTSQLNTLGQQEQKVGKTTQSAVDEARRGFGEIQQGLLARYGTGTSTGQAATSILGGETLKNIGRARAGYQEAVTQINQKRQEIDQISNDQLLEVERDSQTQLQKAKAGLDQELANIGRARGDLAGRKAEVIQGLISDYRNMVASINARNTAFKQQIYLQNQSYQQKLAQASTRATESLSLLEDSFQVGTSRFIPLSNIPENQRSGVPTQGPFAVFNGGTKDDTLLQPAGGTTGGTTDGVAQALKYLE